MSCKAFWEVDHLEAFLFHVEVGRNGSCAPHCHSCQPDVLRYASTDLLSDTGFLKEILQAHHGLTEPNSYHEWASEELQSVCRDREFMLHAVRQNGQALSWVSPDLCNDYDLVSTAVSKNGLAYHRSCAYDRENTFPRTHRSLNIRFVKYHPRVHDSFSLRFVVANTKSIPKKKKKFVKHKHCKILPKSTGFVNKHMLESFNFVFKFEEIIQMRTCFTYTIHSRLFVQHSITSSWSRIANHESAQKSASRMHSIANSKL